MACAWSTEETKALLAVWSEKPVQENLAGSTRNERVFREIASKLEERGIQRTYVQCREKIKKLRQQYKKIVDHNRKNFKWFETMDAVLGGRTDATGDKIQTATDLLNMICGETEPVAESQDEPAGSSSCSQIASEEDEAACAPPSPEDLHAESVLPPPPQSCSTPEKTPRRNGKRKRAQSNNISQTMEEVKEIYQRIDSHFAELLETQKIEAREAVRLGDLLEAQLAARMAQREKETEAFNRMFTSSMEMLAKAVSGRAPHDEAP